MASSFTCFDLVEHRPRETHLAEMQCHETRVHLHLLSVFLESYVKIRIGSYDVAKPCDFRECSH